MFADAYRAVHEKAAKKRQIEAGKHHGRGQKVVVNSSQANGDDSGKARDFVAAEVGIGGQAVDRLTAIGGIPL